MTEPTENKNSNHHYLWWFTAFLLVAGILWLAYWFFYLQYHESTDDAYVNGNLININPAISGSVIAFFADDTDLVKEGQLLVSLDMTQYQIIYNKALSTLASTVLQVRQLYDQVNIARANLQNKETALANAKFDYENRLHLVDSQAISNQDFVHSKNTFNISELEYKQAKYQYEAALAAVGPTSLRNHPLIEEQKKNVYSSYYHLKHCSVYAPATGFVAKRTVDVGNWVNPTTPLMAVIPLNYMWVDANFKETQLSDMRIGQPAAVWFDLYGSSVKYNGKVLGIASGSGSVFSLIPPQNATGNWIKIVQRLAVRISLDPETMNKFPPRLGISANVDVNITDTNLPILAITPPEKPVGTTQVFEINFEEVEKLVEHIIESNSSKADG